MTARALALRVLGVKTRGGEALLRRLLRRGDLVLDAGVRSQAKRLIREVRRGGDAALADAVRRLDGVEISAPSELALRPGPEDEGWKEVSEDFRRALDRAIEAVESFHARQVHGGYRMESEGVELVERRRPLRRVGAYVPGGRASYPSTVVMTVVPARMAGVEEIVVATPPRSYRAMPSVRYTLERLGVTEVWGMGGAHAVAALAYGTESVRRVDKIVGPGNAWVTAAKQLVTGDVAIDGLAGPSEVLIVADGASDPELLAADLLAQAEHDPRAAAVLITESRPLGRAVAEAVERRLGELTTAQTARESLRRFGGVLLVEDLGQAAGLTDEIAPEHLQLVGASAEALVSSIANAGAVFLGASTPEVFGDYIAGPSHVLPTCGNARFASALGVEDFIRRSHVVRFSPRAAARSALDAAVLADAEGLPAHAAAARLRRGGQGRADRLSPEESRDHNGDTP